MARSSHIVVRRMSALRIAGMMTWLAVGAPVVLAACGDATVLSGPRGWGWVVAYAVFGGALWRLSAPRPGVGPARRAALLLALSASAVAANACIPMPFPGVAVTGALLVVSASVAGIVLGVGPGLAWVAAQSAAMLATYLRVWPWQPAAFAAGAYTGFQLFALLAASVAVSEARAREDLAAAHEQLLAGQAALAENARLVERTRIMRELHDVLGHHLSALSLTLEAAGRAGGEQAQELVRRASAIVRLSLSDVRETVHRAESNAPVDLRAELERLAASIIRPSVRVEFDPATPRVGGPAAVALVRCAQECVTNAVRHAGATTIWLRVRPDNDGLDFEAVDDGRGSSGPVGLGLTAMRARIESAGGRLEIHTEPHRGFRVRTWVPAGGAAA